MPAKEEKVRSMEITTSWTLENGALHSPGPTHKREYISLIAMGERDKEWRTSSEGESESESQEGEEENTGRGHRHDFCEGDNDQDDPGG